MVRKICRIVGAFLMLTGSFLLIVAVSMFAVRGRVEMLPVFGASVGAVLFAIYGIRFVVRVTRAL